MENIDWAYVSEQVCRLEADPLNQSIVFDCLYRIGTHAELFSSSNFGAKQRRLVRQWIADNTANITLTVRTPKNPRTRKRRSHSHSE